MPSIPEGEPHGDDGELGAPNSSSDDVVMASRVADLTNNREQWLADLARSTQVSYLEAAQMAAAKELEMQKIQKAQQEAEVYAKAEMDRKYQEAEARWTKAEMEQEAWDEQDWAEMEQLESRAEANWDEQMEQDGQVQAEMANAEATLESAEQWQADVNAEYQGYEAVVDEEGWWDGDRKSNLMAQIVGLADADDDDEGAIRGILFS